MRSALERFVYCGLITMSLVVAPTSTASAQPAAAAAQGSSGTPRELLPDLGHIGAQVSALVGGASSPFEADGGWLLGGLIDLPVANVPGGKLSYEIAITNQRASTDVIITSPLSAVGDLLAADGLGGTLTSRVLASLKAMPATEQMDVMAVAPFGLKYTFTSLDHKRIRPYLVGAVSVYVTITEQNPHLTVDPRLGSAFIGGISPEAIELTARGVPEGQGDVRFGGNVGGGFEVRVAGRASIGVEARIHKMEGKNGQFATWLAKTGIHF